MDVSASPYEYYHVTTTDFSGNEGEPATAGPASQARTQVIPRASALGGIHPNPGGPGMTISFDLARPERVRLSVFDLRGRQVAILTEGARPAGRHIVTWDATNQEGAPVAAGVYFCQLTLNGEMHTKHMIVLR
jgi:hypothetical protein